MKAFLQSFYSDIVYCVCVCVCSLCMSTLKCFIIDFGFIYRAQINHITTVTVKANPFKLIKENYFMRLTNVVRWTGREERENVSFRFPLLLHSHLNMVHGDENTMQLLCCNLKTNRFTFFRWFATVCSKHLLPLLLLLLFHKCFCYIDFVKSMRDTLCGCGVWMVTRTIHDLEACHRFRHWIACKNAIKSI